MDYRKILILFCIILQILDGVFTWYGVTHSQLGLGVEGNPILKNCMAVFGIIPGLLIVKGSAILVIHHLRRTAPTHFFGIIFGIYVFVVGLWFKVIFVDNLIR